MKGVHVSDGKMNLPPADSCKELPIFLTLSVTQWTTIHRESI